MEVHHHSHPSTSSGHRKKWTHYFWEFLMLFLAVFCGFLAEYQLEHKIEKQRAKEFALSLYRDIAADTLGYDRNIRNLNISVANIDSLTVLLRDKDKITNNNRSIYSLSLYAFIFPQYKPNESTIQQLLNSGSLRYFRSNGLIDSVKGYNSEIQSYQEFRGDIGAINIEFRKAQARIIEMDPVITAVLDNSLTDLLKINPDSLIAVHNTPLMTTEPLLIKEYSNWCSLKKFYMVRTALHFTALKGRANAVLRLLKDEYHIK